MLPYISLKISGVYVASKQIKARLLKKSAVRDQCLTYRNVWDRRTDNDIHVNSSHMTGEQNYNIR